MSFSQNPPVHPHKKDAPLSRIASMCWAQICYGKIRLFGLASSIEYKNGNLSHFILPLASDKCTEIAFYCRLFHPKKGSQSYFEAVQPC